MSSSFKKFYDENPEYKRKHLNKMLEKVTCPVCGTVTARSNLTKHKQTYKHKYMENIKQNEDEEVKQLADLMMKLKKKYNNINGLKL